MEQLKFTLPEENEISLEASIQEQLLTVMAEIILTIITTERENGHDCQSS
jgi:hypothetical protein